MCTHSTTHTTHVYTLYYTHNTRVHTVQHTTHYGTSLTTPGVRSRGENDSDSLVEVQTETLWETCFHRSRPKELLPAYECNIVIVIQ